MKILFVSDVSIGAVIGGAERVLYEQTTRLAARGHEIHILTRRLPSHRAKDEVIENVHEWRYRVNSDSPFSFLASTLRNGKKLFEELDKDNNFDCINFHQPFSAFAVTRSPLSEKIRKIYTCHSLAFEEYASRNVRPRSSLKKIVYSFHLFLRKWMEKRVLTRSDRIIVLSRYTHAKLMNIYGVPAEKIAIIPGGIDLVRFHPATEKSAVRESLHLPLDKMILLTVRNLVQRMGLENLILAMQDVVKTLPDISLVIGGTGPLQDDLIRLTRQLHLEEHIALAGFIPENALPEYYRAADIFVLPTVELEGFGLVTLEALASGTPVLGTPIGGTKEILSSLDSRSIFSDASPEAISGLLIDTCNEYMDHPDKWRLDSQRCRQFAEKYSWGANVSLLEQIFSAR
ncbi:MAG: glycosyltransferase family 4 protein [Syntrophales bacterium]